MKSMKLPRHCLLTFDEFKAFQQLVWTDFEQNHLPALLAEPGALDDLQRMPLEDWSWSLLQTEMNHSDNGDLDFDRKRMN